MRSRTLLAVLALTLTAAAAAPPGAAASGPDIHCVGTIELAVTCATTDATIQAAVDRASPGDAVLIGKGTYFETVVVRTPDLVIRGVDRNQVRIAGDAASQPNGILVNADDVEVSNLSVHHFTRNGIFFTHMEGYLARYVTTYNNGAYGIYAYGSVTGTFETSYASGNADSGFYIGECNPCHARIRDVDSVFNALGYSGTNASNDLVIEDSRWIDNGAGIVPNTLDSELLPPQCCIVIRNNVVIGSGAVEAPAAGVAAAALGIGIAISGGSFNVVEDNVIENCTGPEDLCQNRYGIALFPFPEPTPNFYMPNGNVVRNNTVRGSGLFDLALAAPSGEMNCFSGNDHATSDPPSIEDVYPCRIEGSTLRNSPISGSPVSTAELASGLVRFGARGDWRNAPTPPAQPSMPNPLAGLPA